jgi:hypothetical protein
MPSRRVTKVRSPSSRDEAPADIAFEPATGKPSELVVIDATRRQRSVRRESVAMGCALSARQSPSPRSRHHHVIRDPTLLSHDKWSPDATSSNCLAIHA